MCIKNIFIGVLSLVFCTIVFLDSDAVLIEDGFPLLAVKVKAALGDKSTPRGEREHFLCRTLKVCGERRASVCISISFMTANAPKLHE